ncbi:hypothetical protein [Aliikangiella sp. IMCC44359]|uniref:hypothetical protein n=1 Tax=Aliikangiella sp. IMCC44359 TaxID=3459125 RepID=UPI00403AB44D
MYRYLSLVALFFTQSILASETSSTLSPKQTISSPQLFFEPKNLKKTNAFSHQYDITINEEAKQLLGAYIKDLFLSKKATQAGPRMSRVGFERHESIQLPIDFNFSEGNVLAVDTQILSISKVNGSQIVDGKVIDKKSQNTYIVEFDTGKGSGSIGFADVFHMDVQAGRYIYVIQQNPQSKAQYTLHVSDLEAYYQDMKENPEKYPEEEYDQIEPTETEAELKARIKRLREHTRKNAEKIAVKIIMTKLLKISRKEPTN